MPINCGANVARCFMIYFNGFYWLMGAVLLAFGVLFRTNPSLLNLTILVTESQNVYLFLQLAFALQGVGTIIFAVSLIGCCGAVRESKACLAVYAFMICTVIAIEGLGAYKLIGQLPFLTDKLELNFKQLVRQYQKLNSARSQALDYIQVKFECCGQAGPRDYQFSTFWNQTQGQIPTPYSCCKVEDLEDFQFCEECERPRYINNTQCAQDWNKTESLFINVQGCGPHLLNFVFNYKPITISIVAGLLATQFLGVVLAVWLCVAKPATQKEKSEIELPILTRRITGKDSQLLKRTSLSQPKSDMQKICEGEKGENCDSDETQEQSTANHTTYSSSHPEFETLNDANV